MKRLKISAGGQVSVPAPIRHRWGTQVLVAEDRGDHIVLRPAPEDPIEAARGAFRASRGPSVARLREETRREERAAERRKFGDEAG